MQTASGYTLYYTPVPFHYAFAPFLCMYTPVAYSGIMSLTLYIYDAPNKLFKDKKGPVSVSRYTARLRAIGADLGTGH